MTNHIVVVTTKATFLFLTSSCLRNTDTSEEYVEKCQKSVYRIFSHFCDRWTVYWCPLRWWDCPQRSVLLFVFSVVSFLLAQNNSHNFFTSLFSRIGINVKNQFTVQNVVIVRGETVTVLMVLIYSEQWIYSPFWKIYWIQRCIFATIDFISLICRVLYRGDLL